MGEHLNETDEIYCRLSMHEYFLEVVMANFLAIVPAEDSAASKAQMVRVGKKSYGVMTADPAEAQRIVAFNDRLGEMIEHFVQKIARREAELRALAEQ